jgi:hypothetical protein
MQDQGRENVTPAVGVGETRMGVVLGKGKSAKSNFICRDLVLEEIQFVGAICKYAGWLVYLMGPVVDVAAINTGQTSLGPCMTKF